MSVNEKVLDAIQLLASNSINKAQYDKTIQAQILSCEDATIGKYRCRYQDAIIYAYTNNPDISFNNGAYVYILVPGNDMKKEKTILGTTKKLGINYISQAEGDQAYDIIGNNCITSNNKFYLNTINKNYKYTIYQYNGINEINLDNASLNQYIKQSSSLIVGAIFKTNISSDRQYRGHYGITYNLRFLDNTSNKEVVRSYTIDEDNMIDNPYRLIYDTRQYQIFDIDGPNFIRIESIEIFNMDFPRATGDTTGEKLTSGDIEITALEISGAVRMSENEISGVAISFFTPQGIFFTDQSTASSYKTITAQVRVKGKLVSAAQNIPFYWGTENVGITPSSQYYNKSLGRGWKCLNDKNIISEGTEIEDPVIEWVPSNDTYILKFNEATARDNKFKVAIVYDGNVITKTINIQNLATNVPNLTIESSDGTKFYYDIGHPTLICKVNGGQPLNYKYYWAYEDNSGTFSELPVTTEQNTQYDNAVAALESLEAEIATGTKFANAEAENLNNLQTAVRVFNFIQRVKDNKIYDVQINNITSFGIFKCSVYNEQDTYLGTASITLTNSLDGEDLYSLVINNGSAVFQYNENGVAPNSKSLDVQQEIQGLSFTIYDNLGQPIDSDIIANERNCKIRWQFPIKESMLEDRKENEPNSGTDATQTYKYYDNKTNLVYGIAQKYDIKKQRNQIKLTVDYKGMSLTAETDFTFSKQGEPGTNGTEYLVKLIPNTKMDNPPLWPMITKAGDKYMLNYGLGTTASEREIGITSGYQFFKAQLWHSGDLVWEGNSASTSAKDGVTKPSLVHWEILSNKYNQDFSDASAFKVTNASNGSIQYLGDHLAEAIGTPLANIVKCSITWQDKLYYGTIPITTAWTSDEKYKVNLEDYTGFRYAIYTSDGMTPQYDNSHPFGFVCKEKINGTWEDVSLVQGDHAVTYEPIVIGNYLSTVDGTATNSNLLQILTSEAYRDDCQKNQWWARPASKYDGMCVNVAICCIYKQNNTVVGKINVPIHYLLNKYGMAHINEWDGNSVQVDNEGGFILSPQVGAGSKDSNNNFTGVLMGEVRNAGKSNSDTGLLGYSKGDRTFFLNSKNGSALFGKSNQGQIIIDPSQTKALLYSGNFWKEYNEDGLPSNYNAANQNGQGLLIDLTKPEIRYGNGNFYVTKDGYIHASAGGDLAGWKIGTEEITDSQGNRATHSVLYSNSTKNNGRITLDAGIINEETGVISGSGKIYSHSHDELTKTGNGFYLSYDGLSIGSKAKLTNTGVMYIGNGAVTKGGSEDGNYWTINGNSSRSYISYGGSTSYAAATDDDGTTAKVYLGTDGISLGSRFSVNAQGNLTAYSGKIGGWTINKTTLSAGNITLNNNGSMSGGSGDYTWSIATNGKATFNHITANSGGSIGGWTIGSNYLRSTNVTLNSSGAITGSGWSISANGLAHFTKIYGQVPNNYTFVASGFSLGGSGSSIAPATVSMSGGAGINTAGSLGRGLYTAYKAEFDQLYATKAQINNLDVLSRLTYSGIQSSWKRVVYTIRLYADNDSAGRIVLHLVAKDIYAICSSTSFVTDEYTCSTITLDI